MEKTTIERVEALACKIPTDQPEADGTIEWNSTTIVIARVKAGGEWGLGYSYDAAEVAHLIRSSLAPAIEGQDAMAVAGAYQAMIRATRNIGRPGLVSTAISAVDTALWDLKARRLGLPLAVLLGMVRPRIPVYGSGGFTSYSIDKLQQQLSGWVEQGIGRVKMKVGSDPSADLGRVRAAREAIGPAPRLFVDANGAYDRKQALVKAEAFAEYGVCWFEEPVSSDDLAGLRLLRDRAPACMEVTAGEYGSDSLYFRRMLEASAVDVLQADGTRCGGVSGFMKVAALCEAFNMPLSAHTAPSLHAHTCCASAKARNLEYFHDHVRIESMLFDGAREAVQGCLEPDLSRPGLGLELREKEASRYAV